MPDCPACFGDGNHDHRDSDAYFGEHCSDAELDYMRRQGFVHPVGIVECVECEGTGVVTEERRADMHAAAVAAVDQVLAHMDEHVIGSGPSPLAAPA